MNAKAGGSLSSILLPHLMFMQPENLFTLVSNAICYEKIGHFERIKLAEPGRMSYL